MEEELYDVLIVGGSYAGLSAAMTLGRALRNVLVVDAGNPCNVTAPVSHNFLTRDGENPIEIAGLGLEQVRQYDTVFFKSGLVTDILPEGNYFYITTSCGQFAAKRVLLATGMKDILPEIPGFKECWGKSILHCPYCHGYEVRNRPTGLIAKGEHGYKMAMMLNNWTKQLTIFTNGEHGFTQEQMEKFASKNIVVIEQAIHSLEHVNGDVQAIRFTSGEVLPQQVLYARVEYEQHNDLAAKLGCKLTDSGHLFIEAAQETSVKGVYAAGDNNSIARAVSMAIGEGTKAGLAINADLVESEF